MHENGEKQYVWEKHWSMGSASSTVFGGGCGRGHGARDPALPAVGYTAQVRRGPLPIGLPSVRRTAP